MESTSNSSSDGASVMRQLDETENELKHLYHRLETLERNLKYRPMTTEERETMEKDVDQLRNVLKVQEKNLKDLRSENISSMFFAVILMIASFLAFGLYKMYS